MPEVDNRGNGREVADLIIIVVGFGLLMSTMDILPSFLFFGFIHRFWLPTVFIGLGLLLLSRRGHDGMAGGMFFVILGLFFLLGNLNNWRFGYQKWIGPGILIWIGIALLMRSQRPRVNRRDRHAAPFSPPPPPPPPPPHFGDRFERRNMAPDQVIDSSDFVHATAILGAFNRRCTSQQFRGGDLTAIMGGGKIDLRDAHIQEKDAVLDVFAFMGGLEIQVPPGWIIEARLTPILGGISDKTRRDPPGTQRLIVNGTAIMGGVTILN